MSHTLIAFHAHPDDEALLTSGTMARAAAEGHRVVLVVATDGDLGLAGLLELDALDLAGGEAELLVHLKPGHLLRRRSVVADRSAVRGKPLQQADRLEELEGRSLLLHPAARRSLGD